MSFILLSVSPSLTSLPWRKPAAMLWSALWRGPHTKKLRETSHDIQQGAGVLSPTASEELNPDHSHRSECGCVSSLIQVSDVTAARDDSWLLPGRPGVNGTQLSCVQTPDHTNYEAVSVCVKPPSLGEVCNAVTNSKYNFLEVYISTFILTFSNQSSHRSQNLILKVKIWLCYFPI